MHRERLAKRKQNRIERGFIETPSTTLNEAAEFSQGPGGAGHRFSAIQVHPERVSLPELGTGIVRHTPATIVQRQEDPQAASTPAGDNQATPASVSSDANGSTNFQDTPTLAHNTYQGATLQDVAAALPPDEAGSLTFSISASTDGDPTTKATIEISQEMLLPKWVERDKQCSAVQKAWDNFYGALKQHEDGHVAINRQRLSQAHKRYIGKPASSTQSVTTSLETSAKAANDDFDKKTDHGRTGNPPTIIDLTASCKDAGASTEGEGGKPAQFQAKLEVSQPGDPYEEEADRVADLVMRMTDTDSRTVAGSTGGPSVVQRKCTECEEEEKKEQERDKQEERDKGKQALQRKEAHGKPVSDVPSHVTAVTQRDGQPLDSATRAFMEPRFGFDFRHVRIHADSQAAEAARSVDARAYTLGSDVVFGAGLYAPDRSDGRRLLAHELAHVIQQSGEGTLSGREVLARKVEPSHAEPIRKELDSLITINSTLEDRWAALGTDLPEAINDRTIVTTVKNEKTKSYESYADLWWRSIADEGIDITNAGRHVTKQFRKDTLAVARDHVDAQHKRFKQLAEELKNAKQQKATPAPPTSSQAGGIEDEANKLSRKTGPDPKLKTDPRTLVDSATLLHFLLNWEDLLRKSPIATLKVDKSGLLPAPGPVPTGVAPNLLPNAPPTQDSKPEAASPTSMLTFKPEPELTVEKILSMPNLDVFDAEAFAALQKTFRECSEKKTEFSQFADKMMREDAGLAALAKAPGDLLGKVSALGMHSDDVAGDALITMAQDNARASEKFRGMIDKGEVDWLLLRPVWSSLLSGAEGGSRNWTNLTARGFIDAEFKKRKEADEQKALLETAAAVGIAAVTLLAMVTPLGALGAAFFLAVDALTVAGSVADASAAAKKADVTAAGAAAGVVSKDDAQRAKEDADAKQSGMVFNILLTALPYLGHVAKGAGKVAGAVGRSARWAAAARGAEEVKNLANLQKATKEVSAADQAIKEIKGIPDAKNPDVFHELKIGPRGPERCSNHCLIFGQSLSERAKFVQGTEGGKRADLQKRAIELQARGDSISARGKALSEGKAVSEGRVTSTKLSASERKLQEQILLNEAYETEMRMVQLEQEAMGVAGNILPASYKGRWENPASPGNGRWYPNADHAAYKYCGNRGIPYSNGYPNFSELALPGGEVNLLPGRKVVVDGIEKDVGMLGKMSDFEIADALAAQQTGMKDASAFREWRLKRSYTWHHRENGVTMQLVPTELHASIPHMGGASLQRGIPVK